MWGSLKNPKYILLNGLRASITSNLHVALMHLRSADLELIFWIDALCINQRNVYERGQQVSLMRDIYMVAEDVLAWLGPATEGIDLDDKPRVYMDIVSRPYWTRVWIIQEFVLGKKVILQCGNVRHDWDDFYNEFPRDIRQGGKQMRRLSHLKTRYKDQKRGLDLAEAIKFALSSEATDPRDKVYGVLGLVQMNSFTETVTPDYTLSPCEVYHRVIRPIWISRSKGAISQLLMSAPKKDHDLKRCDGQKCGSLNKVIRAC
jgi:hypothetical protein